jgi:pyruvate,water dikinase
MLTLSLTHHTHSLLSHSAVVARELGLPTIVGVSGGLMKRLKTGMRVHVDAGKGKVTIIREEEDKGQLDT